MITNTPTTFQLSPKKVLTVLKKVLTVLKKVLTVLKKAFNKINIFDEVI